MEYYEYYNGFFTENELSKTFYGPSTFRARAFCWDVIVVGCRVCGIFNQINESSLMSIYIWNFKSWIKYIDTSDAVH